MKDMVKASRWAEAAQDTVQAIFWNVWVFLALPVVRHLLFTRKATDSRTPLTKVSLAYAIIFFFISVMSFVWTTVRAFNHVFDLRSGA